MINKIIKTLLHKNKVLNVPETPIDERDWELKEEMLASAENVNSTEFSRRNKTPEVKNQGNIGSCVGHSGRVVYGDTEEFKNSEPSAMWIYKKGKIHDPFAGEDYSGTTIKGACKALKVEGCCEEKYWPYIDSENTKMLEGAQENAKNYKIHSYYVIHKSNHELIKKAILNETLWTSFRVYSAFYATPSSGIVESESYAKSSFAGGHAVAMTGWKYINGELYWEFQNSWGKYFGNKGFFYMESSLYEKMIINNIGPIYIQVKSEEEERKRKQEEERKRREEELKRKQEEERKRKEEELKRKQEEERKRKEEELKRKQEEERKRKEAEDSSKARSKKTRVIIVAILAGFVALIMKSLGIEL
jgi:hypothetical protein